MGGYIHVSIPETHKSRQNRTRQEENEELKRRVSHLESSLKTVRQQLLSWINMAGSMISHCSEAALRSDNLSDEACQDLEDWLQFITPPQHRIAQGNTNVVGSSRTDQ